MCIRDRDFTTAFYCVQDFTTSASNERSTSVPFEDNIRAPNPAQFEMLFKSEQTSLSRCSHFNSGAQWQQCAHCRQPLNMVCCRNMLPAVENLYGLGKLTCLSKSFQLHSRLSLMLLGRIMERVHLFADLDPDGTRLDTLCRYLDEVARMNEWMIEMTAD